MELCKIILFTIAGFTLSYAQGNLGGDGVSFSPVLSPLQVTYGGELLYLWIWRNHSVRSACIILTA